MSETVTIRVTVNGVAYARSVEARLLLVDFLRATLGLTGTHCGCDTSSCGACSVLLGERCIKSCTMLAAQADGQSITTVEGLASADGDLHPLQRAFHEEHGLQCGFCTPGMLITAADLLRHNAEPTETEIRRAIAGNICRCTGYQNIVKAIQSVGGKAKDAGRTRNRSDGAPWIGARLKRKEDLRFLIGRGKYVDDRSFLRPLHLFPVRSPHAHARITGIDTSRAATAPGVIAILAAPDFAAEIVPLAAPVPAPYREIESYPLARDKVRYVGEPVAIVLAESAALAEDGAELVAVEYEVLEPVLDPEASCEASAPLVHENVPSNLAWRRRFTYGDSAAALQRADRVIRRRLHIHRFTSAPLETRQAVVEYDAETGIFHVFSNIGSPERYRPKIAAALKLDPKLFHIECPDIGGGFGMKENTLWVILLCAIARRFGRPAKFVEDRTGHLLANHHSNEVLFDASLALTASGDILALSARAIHDEGAYLGREPRGAVNQLRNATSLYRFRDLEMEFLAVLTNKCPTGANRSYGKVQQTMLVERMIDEAAREMGLDPMALRRRNLVTPAEMPYETPTGAIYDGGDYPQAFAKLDRMFDFASFRAEQQAARAQGRYLGVGIAAGIEASPANASLQQLIDPADRATGDSETALLRLKPDGGVLVALGSVPQGQGHETVVAQIVADALGMTPADIEVTRGYDSWRDPYVASSGTHASRFATMGVGAVSGAARAFRARLLQMAARLSNAPAEDLVLGGGQVMHEASGASLSFAALAKLAPDLEERYVYEAPFGPPGADGRGNFSLTYAYGLALVTVEIDGETGRIKPLRILCIDDCGKLLNPMIVEGMIHGAIAHQVGAALFERIHYDRHGQMTTATFKDYLTPTAADLPRYELDHLETPSLFSALGARGAGEGAGTPMVATINAIADALAPFGARLVEGHVTPGEALGFIRGAAKG